MKKFPLDQIGYVELVHKHPNPLLSVVNSARISYNKEKVEADEKDAKLSKFLWDHKHGSPFRHSHYTFKIKAPLFVMRQWIKHQIGASWLSLETKDGETLDLDLIDLKFDDENGCSWNEVSGRYSRLDSEYYLFPTVRVNPAHGNKQVSTDAAEMDPAVYTQSLIDFQKYTSQCFQLYKSLMERGVAREQARVFLPQNIYTSAVWTTSLQSLLNFFSLRLKPDAQEETRKYAEAILELVGDDLEALGVTL